MKIRITETRTVEYEPNLEYYPEDKQDVHGVIEVEKENAAEHCSEYMDMFDGVETTTEFEILES